MKWKVFIITILATSLLIGTTYAVTIDFDDIPGIGMDHFDGDRYLSQGVQLSSDGIGLGWISYDVSGTSQEKYIYALSDGLYTRDGNLSIDFVVPGTITPAITDYVSFDVIDSNAEYDSWVVRAYDINLILIAETSGDIASPVTFTSGTPIIHRVVFSPEEEYSGGIDTLVFNTPTEAAPVPEPGTMFLLGTGLIGLAGLRKKFRKQ